VSTKKKVARRRREVQYSPRKGFSSERREFATKVLIERAFPELKERKKYVDAVIKDLGDNKNATS